MIYKYFVSYQYYYGSCGVPCDYGNDIIELNNPIVTTEDVRSIENALKGCNRVVILNVVLLGDNDGS